MPRLGSQSQSSSTTQTTTSMQSGLGPVSGITPTGYYGGPWVIETQDCTMKMARVPFYGHTKGPFGLSVNYQGQPNEFLNLSGQAFIEHTCTSTYASYHISTNYRKWYVPEGYEMYPESGYTQPQILNYKIREPQKTLTQI